MRPAFLAGILAGSGGGGASITGTPGIGNTLTAVLSANLGTATTWQWSRNETPIGGATASTYAQVTADALTVVSVTINGAYTASGVSVPGIAPAFASAAVIGAVSAGGAVTFTGPVVGVGAPAPTVTNALYKNGTLVSASYTSGSYSSVVAGDSLQIVSTAANGVAPNATISSAAVTCGGGASTTTVSNVRNASKAGVSEAGDAVNGWSYTANSSDFYTGAVGFVSDLKIPAGQDGWFIVKISNYASAASGFHIGLKTSQVLGAFSTTAVGLYQNAGVGSDCRVSTGGSTALPSVTHAAANGDVFRLRRAGAGNVAGSTLVLELSTDNGVTFWPLQLWHGQSAGDLYLQTDFGGSGVTATGLQMGVITFDAASIAFWQNANLVWDGNSLPGGVGATIGVTDLPTQTYLSMQVPVAFGSTSNVSIAGQTWEQMTSAAADVDGAWVAGKTNVLMLWETTNSIFIAHDTNAAAIAAATSYVTARRAANPWVIACLTTIPREGGAADQPTRNALNAQLAAVDSAMIASPSSFGLDAVVNVRQSGSPFALPDYSDASFNAIASLWYEAAGSYTHLTVPGYAVIAGYVVNALGNMPRTAHQ